MRPLATSSLLLVLAAIGCASPGPPRAPSLWLPQAVKTMTADRVGPAVELRFTVPQKTTDDLFLKTSALGLKVCREVEHGPCTPVPQLPNTISTKNAQGEPNVVTLTDALPAELAAGPSRLLGYRIQLVSQRGRPGPMSDAVYTLAGRAPAKIEGLTVAGSRLGILLSWRGAAEDGSEVILQRDLVSAGVVAETKTPKKGTAKNPLADPLGKAHASSATLFLRATDDPKAAAQNRTLDTSAEDGVPYRYTAYREQHVTLGGRTLLLRSESTLPVAFTLRDTFPPPAPTALTAAFFAMDNGPAVDLIWDPVEDPGLAGYNVYRESAGAARVKLNASPVTLPAFHDKGVVAGVNYRYSVTAVDRMGNESAAAVASTSR